MRPVQKPPDDLYFGQEDLKVGCGMGLYQDMTLEERNDVLRRGYLISSAFTLWEEIWEERNEIFVKNFSKQSKL